MYTLTDVYETVNFVQQQTDVQVSCVQGHIFHFCNLQYNLHTDLLHIINNVCYWHLST